MPNTVDRLANYLRAHQSTVPGTPKVREFPNAPLFVADVAEATDALRKSDHEVRHENTALRERIADLELALGNVGRRVSDALGVPRGG